MAHYESDRRFFNYIRIHRRNAGISQSELGQVLGYPNEESVARHEKFHSLPSLEVAISYEIVFRIPVAEMFSGLREKTELRIEASLIELEERLGARRAQDRNALSTARKLMWLSNRKNSEYRFDEK